MATAVKLMPVMAAYNITLTSVLETEKKMQAYKISCVCFVSLFVSDHN